MLRELSIRNFAIIDDLSVTFEEGLNVLTGETGAGKSIIVNAVNLILGGRASAELIRTSEESAELEALFDAPADQDVIRTAQEQGIDLSEGLVIRRIIQKSGRHRFYLNGRLATAQSLSLISRSLAGIAGQHANQNLMRPDYHLLVLDRFGGTLALREQAAEAYREILPRIKRLTTLKRELDQQKEQMALLGFQVNEIEQARLVVGEEEELELERRRLKHGERIFETVGRCLERLYGEDGAVVERLGVIGKELQALAAIDPALTAPAEKIEGLSYEVEDVAGALRDYLQAVVADTDRLDAVEERLHGLQRLKRKYGGSVEAVIAFGQRAQEELTRVSSLPEEIARDEQALASDHEALAALCRRLSERRREAALSLAKGVEKEAASLGMAKTRFEVDFQSVPFDEDTDPHLVVDGSVADASGVDRVEFLISPNVGEELRPLAQIASGGELSRLVLALKALLATQDSVETLVFDEVDAGIGGEVAEMVGKKLEALSHHHQIICITHLPQIARFGKTHLKIEKRVQGGRTVSSIIALSAKARVEELARMLGGAKVTKKVLAHAREMAEGS